MPRVLYLLGFGACVLLVSLASCVRIQVHIDAPSWTGRGDGRAEATLPSDAPDDATVAARREAEERGHRQKVANLDALVAGAVRIASDTQAWMLKPHAFGGGDGSFAGVSFPKLGYPTEADGSYASLDGRFRLQQVQSYGLRIHAANDRYGNEVVVHVTGSGPDDIRTQVAAPQPASQR